MTAQEKIEIDITQHCLVFYTMLHAVKNTQTVDLSNLLKKELKQDYKAMNNSIDRFMGSFEKDFLTKAGIDLLDEQSYVFLDVMSMMRNKNTKEKTELLFAMMREYIAGKARINDDDTATFTSMPYAYELDGRLYFSSELIGRQFDENNLPIPLYKM